MSATLTEINVVLQDLRNSIHNKCFIPIHRKKNRDTLAYLGITWDDAKDEILHLAQMKYNCCTYNDKPLKTDRLTNILADKQQLNTIDIDLLKSCVSRIEVSHFYTIEIEFINGVTIKNITERKCENDNSTKCNDNSCQSSDG